jgi:hypothetical protein
MKAVVSAIACALSGLAAASKTTVSICDGPLGAGRGWCVNGEITNKGSAAEGLMINSRMIQGVFDDANASTVSMWAYPDTGRWDPNRNTAEFIANFSDYKACGLNAMTVGFQGGGPIAKDFIHEQPWISTAWGFNGEIDSDWRDRMVKVATAADEAGLVLIMQGWYQGQSRRVNTSDEAVIQTINEMIAVITDNQLTNVLMEIANEDNLHFNQPLLTVQEMARNFAYVQKQTSNSILVSSSYTSRYTPPPDVIAGADFALYHCNGLTPANTTVMVESIMSQPAFKAKPKPVFFNECSVDIDVMNAAITAGAGWGYYDQGISDYAQGFQSPPVNWRVDASADKIAYFSRVAQVTGSTATCKVSSH